MQKFIYSQSLIAALRIAIEQKEKEEKNIGYTMGSGLLKGWKETLETLINGEPLLVLNS